ncbi:hypothetical protein GCM10023213_12550 [Prosthecobacter algae]|uniref:Uncharacterized protein n=1 Tax=Prosthecobacter algae TaxID=1144682 RepID=A0ABP9NYI1_9BACT
MKTHAPGAIGTVSLEKVHTKELRGCPPLKGLSGLPFAGFPHLVVACNTPGNACNNETAPFPWG